MKLTNSAAALGGLANICVGVAIAGVTSIGGLVLPVGATVATFGTNAVLGHLGEEHRRSLNFAIRKFRKELEKNWRNWAASSEFGSDADVDSAIAAFETVMPQIVLRPNDLVEQRLNPRNLADLVLIKAAEAMPAAYGTKTAGHREATLARKFLWDLTHSAFAYLLTIQEFVEALQPALWSGLFDQIDQIEDALGKGLDAQSVQMAEMEQRLLEAIETRPQGSSVADEALVALARRVAGDVNDPKQALRELEKAVEIAVSVQNTTDGGSGSLAQVAALSARGAYDEAADTIEDAITLAEQDHKDTIRALLAAGIEQDRLRRDPQGVATKLMRMADLTDAEPATFDQLLAIWMEWFSEGRDRGLLLELSVAGELAHLMKTRATTAEERGRAMNLVGIIHHTKGERETGMQNLLAAIAAFEEALWEWEPTVHPAQWAKGQMNMANTQHALAQRDLGNSRIHRAIASYEAALEGHRKLGDGPMTAMTLMNLGTALRSLAQTDLSTEAARRSIETTKEALAEAAETKDQRQQELIGLNLAMSQRVLAVLENDPAMLGDAVGTFHRLAKTWNSVDMAYYNVTAQLQSGAARIDMALMTGDPHQYQMALVDLRQGIAGLEQIDVPVDALMANGHVALAELGLALHADPSEIGVADAKDRVTGAMQALQDAGHRRGADMVAQLLARIVAASGQPVAEQPATEAPMPAHAGDAEV